MTRPATAPRRPIATATPRPSPVATTAASFTNAGQVAGLSHSLNGAALTLGYSYNQDHQRTGVSASDASFLVSGLPPGGLVTDLVVDPHDPAVVYAGLIEQGVFQSTDGGATWTSINLGLPVAAYFGPLRLDPGPPRTLYAGTAGSGVWALTLP